MPCDRAVFNEVEKLVGDVAEFATKLAATLADAIDSLPSPARLMEMVGDFIKERLLNDGGLCFAPSCPGIHINTGVEEDLVPDMDDLEILASHHITHAYRPCNVAHTTLPTQRISPTRVSKTLPIHALPSPTALAMPTLSRLLVSRPVWSNVAGAHHIVRLLQDV